MNQEQQIQQLLQMGVPIEEIAVRLNLDRSLVENILNRSALSEIPRPDAVMSPPIIPGSSDVDPSEILPQQILGNIDLNVEIPDSEIAQISPEVPNIIRDVLSDEEGGAQEKITKKLEDIEENASPADEAILEGATRKIESGDKDNFNQGVGLVSFLDSQSDIPVKEKMKLYREFAQELYGSDEEYQKLVNPKGNLPLFLLGATLVQQGAEGKNLGEALPESLSQYFGAKVKQDENLRKFQLSRLQKENELAAKLYISDVESQRSLEKSLNNQTRKLYKIEGNDNPVAYTSNQVGYLTQKFPGYIQDDWSSKYGDYKDYTVYNDSDGDGQPDKGGAVVTQLLSQSGALKLQEDGFIVREGNQIKENKMYKINGRNLSLSLEELEVYREGGATIEPGGQMRTIKVRDSADGKTKQIYLADYNDNPDQYSLLETGSNLIIDPDGNVIFSQGGGQGNLASFYTESQLGKKQGEIETKLSDKAGQRDAVLNTGFNVLKLLDEAEAAGTPILFGTAGQLTTLGKRVINEFKQFEKIADRNDYGYRGFVDANNNGIRDPEEKTLDLKDFQSQFGDQFIESGLGKFLSQSGLSKSLLNNFVFTLALQSAALNNQKGRDISDKDIERFLRRAGGQATSEAEFKLLVGQLMNDAITSFDTLAGGYRFDLTKVKREGQEDVSFYDVFVKPKVEEEEGYKPFEKKGDNRTIAELREEYGSISFVPSGASGSDDKIDVNQIAVLSGGDVLSGIKNNTIHDLYLNIIAQQSLGTSGQYLSTLQNELEPEVFQALVGYVNQQNEANK
jgi:hypothetical protein